MVDLYEPPASCMCFIAGELLRTAPWSLGMIRSISISRRVAMLLVYLFLFLIVLFICLVIFPKWILIGVPVLLILSALAERSLKG